MQAKNRRHVRGDDRGQGTTSTRSRADVTTAASRAKTPPARSLYAAERATWMALEAIQCLGGNGYINDFPTGRLLRDANLYEIGAGTSEIRRMLIGREIYKNGAMNTTAAAPARHGSYSRRTQR